MKILSKLDNTGMIEETADKRYVTDAEKLTWNGKADKTYVDSELAVKVDNSRVLTDVPANAKFTDTITSVNGQTGDIELTGDDIDYFDYESSQYRNVGSTLSEINETIFAFMFFVLGAGYDIFDDPTLEEILEMLTIVLGDYELGIAPSLGEIVEEMESNKTTVEGSLELKADKTYVDSRDLLKADKTYVDSKVQTDVPADAMFTDTITTINGKTGAIKKDDIVALGIPASMHPNLTLGELTLGGRFKIVYNDIEDSLDIEVI